MDSSNKITPGTTPDDLTGRDMLIETACFPSLPARPICWLIIQSEEGFPTFTTARTSLTSAPIEAQLEATNTLALKICLVRWAILFPYGYLCGSLKSAMTLAFSALLLLPVILTTVSLVKWGLARYSACSLSQPAGTNDLLVGFP